MAMTREQILAAAMTLGPNDREAIADELLQSIAPLQTDTVDARWLREARRRGAEIQRGVVEPVAGDQVMSDARAAVRAMRK